MGPQGDRGLKGEPGLPGRDGEKGDRGYPGTTVSITQEKFSCDLPIMCENS